MSAPLRIRRSTVKAVTAEDELKPYLDRLLKLIPAEVLSLYLVGIGFVPNEKFWMVCAWSLFCLVAVGIVKAYGTSDPARNLKPDFVHVSLSMVAFVVWVYSMGGPFKFLGWYESYVGSLLILGFTFIVPYLYQGQVDRRGSDR